MFLCGSERKAAVDAYSISVAIRFSAPLGLQRYMYSPEYTKLGIKSLVYVLMSTSRMTFVSMKAFSCSHFHRKFSHKPTVSTFI